MSNPLFRVASAPPPGNDGRLVRFEAPVVVSKQIRWDTPIEIGAFSMLHGPGSIAAATLGRFCSVAPDAVIGANEHPISWLTSSSLSENPNLFGWSRIMTGRDYDLRPYGESLRPIKIGNDVWIGQGAFIRGGTNIGDGAVIGAQSNVISDVPPYAIYAGNPARLIRYRFSEYLIEQLLDRKWWQYSAFDLTRFDLSDPQRALDMLADAEANHSILSYAPNWTSGAAIFRKDETE